MDEINQKRAAISAAITWNKRGLPGMKAQRSDLNKGSGMTYRIILDISYMHVCEWQRPPAW
jgi:hypothetical protein